MTDAPNSPDELARAVEKLDTVCRLMGDGRTELGAISDVFGTTMYRRDKFVIALRLTLSRLASQEETIRADGEALADLEHGATTLHAAFVKDGVYDGEKGRAIRRFTPALRKARARLSARQEGGAG